MEKFDLFFNTDDEFNITLGETSYYKSMQNAISKIFSKHESLYAIEFGCGMGGTILRLAKENTNTSFVGVDNRENIVALVNEKTELTKAKNITLVNGDLNQLDTFNFKNVDFVYLSYSFNFINVDKKQLFLENIYKKMKPSAKLIIGDWFLPETSGTDLKQQTTFVYNQRIEEGKRSIYWSLINDFKKDEFQKISSVINQFEKYHIELLDQIIKKKNIYPTSMNWLVKKASEVGFDIVLSEYINNVLDGVVVLSR